MATQKYPLLVPPAVARHLRKALREEIDRQEKLGETLREEEEWPDDYDPNDVALFKRWDRWLDDAVVSGGNLEDPTLKPVEYLMEFVPVYAKKYADSIPRQELEEIFRVYAEYVASYCASVLPDELARQTSRSNWMQRYFLHLMNFPRPPASTDK